MTGALVAVAAVAMAVARVESLSLDAIIATSLLREEPSLYR
jgi:hypothetical protein